MNLEKILRNKLMILVTGWLVLAGMLLFSSQQFGPDIKTGGKPFPTGSQERYDILKDQYIGIVTTQGPGEAVDKLKIESEKDPGTLYYCHDLMHEIGRASIIMLKDFSKAAAFQDATCVSGYIHGVLQEYFSSSEDVYFAMKSVCNAHKRNNYYAWECYHGVGHGLMYYSENDLPESIKRCGVYPEFAMTACANGVYMENFTADEKTHPTIYRKVKDPFYPCRTQAEGYKSGCYQSAPIYFLAINKYDYKSALKWCGSAEKDFRRNCYSGVGSQATRKNMQNIKYVESICAKGDTLQKSWCIAGMINYYIGHYGSIEKAEALCGKFDRKNQAICDKAVLLHAKNFK